MKGVLGLGLIKGVLGLGCVLCVLLGFRLHHRNSVAAEQVQG